MTQARPILPDDARGGGAPVFVERYGPSFVEGRPRNRSAVTHQFAVLGFYTGGSASVQQGPEWRVRAGDVLLVPPGQPHRMLEATRPELWGVGLSTTGFSADDAALLRLPFERVRAGASAVVHIPSPRHAFLESLFVELHEVTRPRQAAPLEIQRSLLALILNEVARATTASDGATAPLGVVAESLSFIERNCLRRLSLKEVARAVGRTPAYVTTALTKATGRSAVAWITAGRMAEARRRLLHSAEPVELIARRVGYEDATHFIRLFKRDHGATPAAWRGQQRAKVASRSPPAAWSGHG